MSKISGTMKSDEVVKLSKIKEEGANNLGTQPKENKDIENPSVYLIYDFPDQAAIKNLKDFLEIEKYSIVEPNFGGTLTDRRIKHENNLITADIMIIYYPRENQKWLRTKLLDVLKSPGLGRQKSQIFKALYIPQSVNLKTEHFFNYQISIINAEDDFPFKTLKEFLNKVSASHAAESK